MNNNLYTSLPTIQPNYNTIQPNYTIQPTYTMEPNYNTMEPNYNTMEPNYNTIEPNYNTIQPSIITKDNLSNYKYLKTKREQSTIYVYYVHKTNNTIIKINMYNL